MAVNQPKTQEEYDTGRALLLATVAALGGFLFGFDTAVINGAVTAVRAEFHMGDLLTGFTVSSALLGCVVGAYAAGWLADRQGRIKVMVLAAALFVISALGSGLAFSPWELILWRVIGGLGVGAASVIAPAYIAEISPASIRGRMGSLQQLAIVTGIFIALLSDAFLAAAGRRSRQAAVVRSGSLALDVPRRASSRPWPTASVAADPGVPATWCPGGERQGALRAQPGPQDRHRRAHVGDPSHRGAGGALVLQGPGEAGRRRSVADRLGRHRTVGLPAVRRHQRDLLLLLGAVAAGRLQRE